MWISPWTHHHIQDNEYTYNHLRSFLLPLFLPPTTPYLGMCAFVCVCIRRKPEFVWLHVAINSSFPLPFTQLAGFRAPRTRQQPRTPGSPTCSRYNPYSCLSTQCPPFRSWSSPRSTPRPTGPLRILISCELPQDSNTCQVPNVWCSLTPFQHLFMRYFLGLNKQP